MIDFEKFKVLVQHEDWESVYAMLDEARDNAASTDDVRDEIHWRSFALEGQRRYEEAIDLLRKNADVFNSQSSVQHELACLLLKLGRDQEALDELSKAPFEAEMKSFYGLAIDAKFFYLYLLAKTGDQSVRGRLSEIPDDYRHITMDGKFLTKPDIVAALAGAEGNLSPLSG